MIDKDDITPRLIERKEIYSGRTFKLFKEIYSGKNGNVTIDAIRHRGAVAILPILPDGRIILEKQFRYTISRWIIEAPAGTLEEGESDEACARRELKEETGYVVEKLVKIGSIAMTPGYDDEVIRLFVAYVSNKVESRKLDEDEMININYYTHQEINEMIKKGEIFDAKTIALFYLSKELGFF